MRDRINEMKGLIQDEKNRAQESHREKVHEIRQIKDFAEVREWYAGLAVF